MESAIYPESLAEARQFVDMLVAGGFVGEDDIVESAVGSLSDWLKDSESGTVEESQLWEAARAMVGEALAHHQAEQANWPAVTDCDRLDAAFEELGRDGIVCRPDFSCCGTCGAIEILDEMEAAERQGLPVRGYTFYHQQDTEHAVEGDGICLNYGSTDEGDAAAVAIGHEVVHALRRHGLTVEWNGDISKRIEVGMDWKRRR